ncbi:MAG: signal peptidase II [Bryobacteraceae bacterium]|jgi:signal peptidase II
MAEGRFKAYAAAAAVFGLDRLTKVIIEQRVSEIASYRVIPGFFDIVRTENHGVAFGIFNDSTFEWRSLALIVVAVAAMIFIGVYLWRARHIETSTLWGLALIMGGAAGNAFDRIVSGRVTDFLDFHIGGYYWPTFNVADSCVVIGSGLLLLDMLLSKRQAANVP